MEEKSNVSRFTVSLSTEGNNALNAIMTLKTAIQIAKKVM